MEDDSEELSKDLNIGHHKKDYYEKIKTLKYHPTTLNIYLLTNGDLNISEKLKFEYNMLRKDLRSSPSHFYLLKNTKFDNYIIENAGYNVDDHEIFSKDYKFENILNYTDEKMIKPSNTEIENNINENIAFILKKFFPYKKEIKLKSKEYVIAKYKILYERGIVHLYKDNFVDINFKDDKPIYNFKTLKELLREKRVSEKDDLSKENSTVNSINITIDLTILDKSKNPTNEDFLRTSCNEKRKNLNDTYNKLLFSLFGVNLKRDEEEERRKRYNIRFHYKYTKKKDDKKKYNYPYGYGYPYPYRQGIYNYPYRPGSTYPYRYTGGKNTKRNKNTRKIKHIKVKKTPKSKNTESKKDDM